jgi:hypothetical protein
MELVVLEQGLYEDGADGVGLGGVEGVRCGVAVLILNHVPSSSVSCPYARSWADNFSFLLINFKSLCALNMLSLPSTAITLQSWTKAGRHLSGTWYFTHFKVDHVSVLVELDEGDNKNRNPSVQQKVSSTVTTTTFVISLSFDPRAPLPLFFVLVHVSLFGLSLFPFSFVCSAVYSLSQLLSQTMGRLDLVRVA